MLGGQLPIRFILKIYVLISYITSKSECFHVSLYRALLLQEIENFIWSKNGLDHLVLLSCKDTKFSMDSFVWKELLSKYVFLSFFKITLFCFGTNALFPSNLSKYIKQMNNRDAFFLRTYNQIYKCSSFKSDCVF